MSGRASRRRNFRYALAALCLVWNLAQVTPSHAAIVSNSVTGTASGSALDLSQATVTLNVLSNNAIVSALAEINPAYVAASSTGNVFTVSVLPTLDTGSTGVDNVTLTTPAGYSALTLQTVTVGGTALTAACPTPAAGQYCGTVSGAAITLQFGSKIVTTLTSVTLQLTATAPPTPGSGVFTVTLDDTSTATAAQSATPGNADGDASNSNSLTVTVDQRADAAQSEVSADPPIVIADGKASATITVTLRDASRQALPRKNVTLSSNRNGSVSIDTLTQPSVATNAQGITQGAIRSLTPGVATISAVDTTDNVTVTQTPTVYFTQGQVLNITKTVNKREVRIGEAVTYQVEIRNKVTRDVVLVHVIDKPPPNFKYLLGSAQLGATHIADPSGQRPLHFDVGTVPALNDLNHNGQADPGEPGYLVLSYQLVVTAGATPGTYSNTAVATDVCDLCTISNQDQAHVTVALDPLFDLGTVIGKVFEDKNHNGHQEENEPGVAGAMVALDDGSYVLTDTYGRYHFPAINPGDHLLKINLKSLPADAKMTTPELAVASISPGLLAKVNFGVVYEPNRITLGKDGVPGVMMQSRAEEWVGGDVVGNLNDLSVLLNGHALSLGRADVHLQMADQDTDYVVIAGDQPTLLLRFMLDTVRPEAVVQWHLVIMTPEGALLRRLHGEGLPPLALEWDGKDDNGVTLLGGQHYHYQASFNYNDASRVLTPRRAFALEWRPVVSTEAPQINAVPIALLPPPLIDTYRTPMRARVNGQEATVDTHGRFHVHVDSVEPLSLDLINETGQTLSLRRGMPTVNVSAPGAATLKYGQQGGDYRVAPTPDITPLATVDLRGNTTPGNHAVMDETPLPLSSSGAFSATLDLNPGTERHALVVANPEGYPRITEIETDLKNQNAAGGVLYLEDPVPHVTLDLPKQGEVLRYPLLTVTGQTSPHNNVQINDHVITLEPDGRFSQVVNLVQGKNHLRVQIADVPGYVTVVERDVTVSQTELFFLAFADGKVGQLQGKGYLQGGGMTAPAEFYSEGRLAYYLKGVIQGKYLITSALDTGTHRVGDLFKGLTEVDTTRLSTVLDPEKYYPVYGDSSTLVHDSQSQGRFYLAVDSNTFGIRVGNYPINLNGTQLATWQRTLYGARAVYRSMAKSHYGDPDTAVEVFGADVRQAPAQDELRATGGSLYYLKNSQVVEGGEQITLLVRDKTSGEILSRLPQTRDRDYTMKYEEGRVLFNRPLSSVSGDDLLISNAALAGHPVYVQINYEYLAVNFAKSAAGGRVRQQLGDHVALGATYVQDELATGSYQLQGLDAEFRFKENTRLHIENAQSSGAGTDVNVSDDGGLSWRTQAAVSTASSTAQAQSLSLSADLGEWFTPLERLRIEGYFKHLDAGFKSNGNTDAQGRTLQGGTLRYGLSARDQLLLRYVSEQRLSSTVASDQTTTTTVQWQHRRERWDVTGELQSQDNTTATTAAAITSTQTAAARLRTKITDKTTGRIEHQQTLSGTDNTQSTLGIEYQATTSLALQGSVSNGAQGQGAQAGVVFNRDGNRIYLTERVTDSRVDKTQTTIVGGETPWGERGAGKLYTEHQSEQNAQNARDMALVGAQRNWDVTPGLRLTLGGEYGTGNATAGSIERYALATGVSYASTTGWSVATRNELRREFGAQSLRQFLTINQGELKITPDYTGLVKLRYSITSGPLVSTTTAEFAEYTLGLAYRPVNSDRFNALARYNHLLDRRAMVNGRAPQDMTRDILGAEWTYDLTRRISWVDKTAYRITTEGFVGRPRFTGHTWLSLHRLNFHVRRNIDLSQEYRLLVQQETHTQRQGWLSEIAWLPTPNFRLGLGFNFTDFTDSDYAPDNYSIHGWFLRFQGMQ